MALIAPAAPAGRHPGLDRARAVAVLAMVMGHSLDAVLSDEARYLPGVVAYWSLRAITAPLFLFVAGWAFAATVQRTGAGGTRVLRRYLPRVALLLGLGYLLRWPGWAMEAFLAGDREVWRHTLAFDALHGVAGALLVGALLLSAVSGRAWRMGALALLAVLYPAVSPLLREAARAGDWPLLLEQALVGRTSNFPLFPWSAYFFAGGFAGLGLGLLRLHPPWVLLGTGTAVLAAMQLGWGGNPEVSDLTLAAWRLGMLLVVSGLAMVAPPWADRLLSPVGRASLWVYVVHLPIAYGWSTVPGLAGRLGHSLGVAQAVGAALGVLAVSLALALPAKGLYGRWRSRRRVALQQVPPAPGPEGNAPATSAVAGTSASWQASLWRKTSGA